MDTNIFDFLKEYSTGAVIGNSGLYRREDESMEDFANRVQTTAQGTGQWGTTGRPVNALFNAGFVNDLPTVNRNGTDYQQVGEDITSADFRKRLLDNDPKGNIAKYFNQYDPSSISMNDGEFGYLMQKDKYDELVRAIDSNKSEGFMSYNSPFEAFGKTIGPAMGLSNIVNSLGGFGNQSLWSSLSANAAEQGGSFTDIMKSFGLGGGESAPWGVNPRIQFPDTTAPGGAFDMGGSAGVFDSFGNPLYQAPNALQTFLGQLQGGLDSVNSVLGSGKNPLTLGGLGMAGANWFIQSSLADKYMSAADKAADKANALNDPRRGPYQQALSQLLTNPQQFFSTNPVVQGQLDLARQQFQANTAKMGTGGTAFNDYLKNVQNIASGTFNDQAQLLAGLGGFNQGAGFSGNVFANLANQGITQQGQAYSLFPDILRKVFGGIGGPNNSNGPASGTTVSSPY